uniref:ATP synthase CFO B' subunit subunit II n=1 Tax=Timspurckia oligopyrenoides TaxID=708627 RepID=UPI001FCDD721|nr:ATP synthase CFO B' subunit subunit II [Timspurckia oligopyrenoides]UNJ17471.1 ATP synthase CFO B' subunit subunit II [Timspurckia oligopyrenoides]
MIYLPFLLAIEESEGGLFDFNATLPLMALQFLILTAVLNQIFYKPITAVVDERDEYIKNSLTMASNNLMQANELTKRYEQELSKARQEAQVIISRSKQEAQDIVTINIQEAQQEAEKMIAEASEQLNLQKEKALKTLESQVDILSEQIKSKLLTTN